MGSMPSSAQETFANTCPGQCFRPAARATARPQAPAAAPRTPADSARSEPADLSTPRGRWRARAAALDGAQFRRPGPPNRRHRRRLRTAVTLPQRRRQLRTQQIVLTQHRHQRVRRQLTLRPRSRQRPVELLPPVQDPLPPVTGAPVAPFTSPSRSSVIGKPGTETTEADLRNDSAAATVHDPSPTPAGPGEDSRLALVVLVGVHV